MERPDSRPHLEVPDTPPEGPLDPARLRWIFAAVVLLGLFGVWHVAHSLPDAGATAPGEPIQEDLPSGPSWSRGDYRYHALARYHIRARVLSTDRYYFDAFAAVSPLDVAVGWGPMSDSRDLKGISVSQRGRFVWLSNWRSPLSQSEMMEHAANMHMIPASWWVRLQLMGVGRDDIVTLDGYLVQISGPHGFNVVSSLSRDDTGAGACEVMWVEKVSTE